MSTSFLLPSPANLHVLIFRSFPSEIVPDGVLKVKPELEVEVVSDWLAERPKFGWRPQNGVQIRFQASSSKSFLHRKGY